MLNVAATAVLTEAFTHGLFITLVAVALVTMAMPGVPPKNAMWMCIVLIMCIAQIVGWISLSGMTFWAQTLAQTTIAVGLAVDYSLHIGHAFGHSTGHSCGKRARAQHALTSMGSSVLRGALTTALGIVPLFLGDWSALHEFANSE
jgi:predicted RND superfamily exporter protein|eukprot:COSAG06_NODE_727_length_12752_cov_61.232277_6_plen_146_part_00